MYQKQWMLFIHSFLPSTNIQYVTLLCTKHCATCYGCSHEKKRRRPSHYKFGLVWKSPRLVGKRCALNPLTNA